MADKHTFINKLLSGVATYVQGFAKEALVEAVDKQIEKSRPKRKSQLRKRVSRSSK